MREGEKKKKAEKAEEETVFRKENQGRENITNQEKGCDNGERTYRVLLGHRFTIDRKHFNGVEHCNWSKS